MALDGGGIKGLLTSTVVDYLEGYAYKYAKETYDIEERDEEKIHMVELFNSIGGTSTGSILAAMLVCPNDNGTNRYTAEAASNLYLT